MVASSALAAYIVELFVIYAASNMLDSYGSLLDFTAYVGYKYVGYKKKTTVWMLIE